MVVNVYPPGVTIVFHPYVEARLAARNVNEDHIRDAIVRPVSRDSVRRRGHFVLGLHIPGRGHWSITVRETYNNDETVCEMIEIIGAIQSPARTR
jgi:hypothetical protein